METRSRFPMLCAEQHAVEEKTETDDLEIMKVFYTRADGHYPLLLLNSVPATHIVPTQPSGQHGNFFGNHVQIASVTSVELANTVGMAYRQISCGSSISRTITRRKALASLANRSPYPDHPSALFAAQNGGPDPKRGCQK